MLELQASYEQRKKAAEDKLFLTEKIKHEHSLTKAKQLQKMMIEKDRRRKEKLEEERKANFLRVLKEAEEKKGRLQSEVTS